MIDQLESMSKSHLYFSQIYFYSESANSGIAVEYPDVIIHAISRQEGQPNIYCQLDAGLFFPNQQLPEDEQEREETVTELRLIPRDGGACKFFGHCLCL